MSSTKELCSITHNKIKSVCQGLFLEGKLKVYEQRIPINTVFLKLLAKVRSESLQGEYLQERLDILKRDPDEIYEKSMEIMEKLFSKRHCYAHAYVCCLMIVLKQRTTLGLPHIELHYIKRALKLYKRVSKKDNRRELSIFSPIFATILTEAGKISLNYYIFVKMQLYLSYFHKYHGDPALGVAQMIVYLNYRFDYGMYSRIEEIIAELLVCTIDCIEQNFLNQALHLLNGVRALLDRLSGDDSQMRFQKVVLLEFLVLITALLLTKNIENVRGYQNPDITQDERKKFIPKEDVTLLKLEVDDLVRIRVVPVTATNVQVDMMKAKLMKYKKILKEPLIADLAGVFNKIMIFLERTESFSDLPGDLEDLKI